LFSVYMSGDPKKCSFEYLLFPEWMGNVTEKRSTKWEWVFGVRAPWWPKFEGSNI
jgi:hypothetical protein